MFKINQYKKALYFLLIKICFLKKALESLLNQNLLSVQTINIFLRHKGKGYTQALKVNH